MEELEKNWIKILEEGIRKGKVLIEGRFGNKPVVSLADAGGYLCDRFGYHPQVGEDIGFIIGGKETDWYRLSSWEEDYDSYDTYEDFTDNITYNEFITKYGNSTK